MSTHIDTIVNQTAGMVATELGEGWTVDTDWTGWGALLNGPDGAQVALTHDRTGYTNDDVDRVRVAGVYPHQEHNLSHYNPTRFKATVRRDRGPAVIAREINRRVLTGYLPELKKVNEAIERAKSEADSQAAAVAALSNIAEWARADGDRIRLSLPTGYGDVQVGSRGTASVEFSYIPVDLAEAILTAVRDYFAR